MNHPLRKEIADVVFAQATEAEADAVLTHVENCSQCEEVMAELETTTNEMIERLRQPVGENLYEMEAECRDFVSLAETMAGRPTDETPGQSPSEGDELAHFPVDNMYDTTPAHQSAGRRLLPAKMGRYQIQSQLGRGGFGVVLLARDDELNRSVAIKLPIVGQLQSEDEIQEFVREARTAAGLKHPGIVTVYDVGRLDDGTPFVVMEYIEGTTLKDLLKEQPLTPARSAELMIQIVEAVGVAHQQGFVHRDLKPENILIDQDGKPHVADFGLAVHESEQRHQAGKFSGTPCYMSPEQIRGEVHRLDGRADVWALGTVFYEMLTGRRAFGGTNFRQVADEILHRLPKPPRQIDENIPLELQRICLRCCEKDMADRYSSAADIALDLRAFLVSMEETAPLANLPADSQPRSLNRFGAILVTVAVAVSIIAVLWYSALNPNSEPNKSASDISKEGLNVQQGGNPAGPQDTIDVLVWDPGDQLRRGIRLDERDALPLRANDQIRVEAKLSKPSYAYIVWIDSEGAALPVYPWTPGDWKNRPPGESPVSQVSLPEQIDRGWPMGGVAGMETLLLLVRDTPLPADFDLQKILTGLPKQTSQHAGSLVWFADGAAIVDERDRAPKFFEVQQIDDQVLKTQRMIHEHLSSHFESIRAVSFANRGE